MKRTVSIIALLLTAVMLFGCAAQNNSNSQNANSAAPSASAKTDGQNLSGWDVIKSKGEIVIGLDDTFAPMGFRDEAGKLVGFDIDFATAVCEKLGIKPKFQPINWDIKESELANKKVDCLWNGLSKTPEREKAWTLTKPYLNNTLVMMYKKGAKAIAKKADLVGKKIGVQAKSSALEALEAEANYAELKPNVSEYTSYDDAIMDLEIGRIDVIVIDEVLGRYKASKKTDTFEFGTEKFADDLYVVGMRKEDTVLCQELEKAMKAVIDSGAGADISVKWFSKDILISN